MEATAETTTIKQGNLGPTQRRILRQFDGRTIDAPLRDKDLEERLGVSRSAIRNATKRLVARGMLRVETVEGVHNRFYYRTEQA